MIKEAMYYKTLENGEVICELCPHYCRIQDGGIGLCKARKNQSSILVTLNYGEISSFGLDPIEKKPLYHYKPGTTIMSVGSFGCNFDCGFCQNYSISKGSPETAFMTTDSLIGKAMELRSEKNIGIAFTYNEPTIWYEYIKEGAQKAKKAGLDVVLVTNGYINSKPLKELLPYVDALNIDLKSMKDEFYQKICNGDVKSVKKAIELADNYCHVEITTLLIGGYNNEKDEIRALAKWIESINPDIPLHLSRYHPAYKFTEPQTSVESMKSCLQIAKENIKYVYLGNVWGNENNTYCYHCGKELIRRDDFEVKILIKNNLCQNCGAKINIIL
jgi:pyruvate formate lyase activating enzyme